MSSDPNRSQGHPDSSRPDRDTDSSEASTDTRSSDPIGGRFSKLLIRVGPSNELVYRNYKGEIETRRIIPCTIWYGSTEWHKKTQWLMDAWDCDKGAMRTFALSGFLEKTGYILADGANQEELSGPVYGPVKLPGTAVPAPEAYNEHDDSAYQCGKDKD